MQLFKFTEPHIEPRVLAVGIGVISSYYVHKFPMRGDEALVLITAFGIVLAVAAYVQRPDLSNALRFAFSMISYQYLSLAAATIGYRLSPFHPLYYIPGPLLNKITSLTLAHMVYSGKRYLVIKEWHKEYGRVVRTGPNTLSINSPKVVSTLYSSSNAPSKSHAYNVGRMRGHGLFFIMDRDEHNVRRKVWAPGFTTSAISSYTAAIDGRVQQMLNTLWKRRRGLHGTVNLTELLQHWSYDVMGELTYGHANKIEMMDEGDPEEYVENGETATIIFESLGEVPALFDIIWHLPFSKSINKLEKLGERLIEARAGSNEGSSDDLASHLLGEHDPSLPRLTFDDLRVDSLFAIQAGSDTTAGVLIFLFYYLLCDQESYARLQAELDSVFPDPHADLDTQKLNDLPFLSAICEESLRLGTPFGGLPRVVQKGGLIVDGVFIPENTIVAVPPWASQTDPENVWPEPDKFIPQRWMPGGLGPDSRLVKHAMLSFSYGPFGCIGRPLAYRELRIVAARMLLTYDLKLSPEFDHAAFVRGIDNMRTTVFRYPLLIVAQKRNK